jgi:hypothetical protein
MQPRFFILFLALSTLLSAQQGREQSMIGDLRTAPDRAAFEGALATAKKAEMSPQMLSEAKLLFGLRTQDTGYLVALLPELDAVGLDFTASHSLMGVRTVDQWRGLVAYVRALRAAEAKDEDTFREEINAAMWQCPQQASLFGSAVARFQLQQKMQRWTVDFSHPLTEVGARGTTLGDALGTQSALVLLFWETDDERSRSILTRMNGIAKHVRLSGIGVLGIHVQGGKGEPLAEKVRKELKIDWPWTFVPDDQALVRAIEVDEFPRAVVLTRQGKVIFHGHPLEPSLWQALKRVAPLIKPMPAGPAK